MHEGEVSNQRVCTLSTGGIGQGNYQGWLACVYRTGVCWCANVRGGAASLSQREGIRSALDLSCQFGHHQLGGILFQVCVRFLACLCMRACSVFVWMSGSLDAWIHECMSARV